MRARRNNAILISTAACLLAAIVAVGLQSTASAQQYKSDKVNNALRLDNVLAKKCVNDPASYAQDKAKFAAYFSEYHFPTMTHFEPEALEELGNLRRDLFLRYLWATQNTELQHDLTALAFKAMLPIVKDPGYHPAVRYNAILVLGMLDEQYGVDTGADRQPPKPLPDGSRLLVQVVKVGLAGNSVVTPPILVGALIGLERHAKYHESIAPETLAAMSTEALNIVNVKEPLPDIDSEVFAWIQLKAASVLANLGAVGKGNEVHNALMSLIANKGMSLDDRCLVAEYLGSIKYEGTKLDAKSTVEPLAQLALDVSQSEAKRAEKYQDRHSGGGYGGGYGRGRGGRGGGGYDSEEGEKYERRQLLSLLTDLSGGLTGVKTALPADAQAKVDVLLAAIVPVIDAASDEDTVDLDVTSKVQTMATEIKRAVGSGVTASADEVPAGDS